MPLYFVIPIPVTGVTLNSNVVSLNEIGQTFQLIATVLPVDAENKNVVWSSSDTSIATVTQDGLVTCVTPGDCSITVTTEDGGYTATATVRDWLPNEYQEVECIRGDGNAYINTGITASTVRQIKMKANNFTMGSSYADSYSIIVFGTTVSSWWLSSTYYVYSGSRFRYHLGDGTRRYFDCNASQYNYINNIEYNFSDFEVNGNAGVYQNTDTSWADASAGQLCFWYCGNNSRSAYDLYELEITTTDDYYQYIPCYRKSDGVIGLYERIHKVFYTNAGSGTFLKGLKKTSYNFVPTDSTISYYKMQSDFVDEKSYATLSLNDVNTYCGMVNVNSQTSYMIPSVAYNQSNITVSVWYYYRAYSTGGGWNTLFARNGGSYHHVLIPATTSSGTLGNIGWYNAGWVPSGTVLELGQWYHIVFTKSGTSHKIYVNNNLIQSGTSWDNATYPLGAFANYQSGQQQGAQGYWRDLIIENREWTTNDISGYYSNMVDKFYT